jgi:hypothetical protein
MWSRLPRYRDASASRITEASHGNSEIREMTQVVVQNQWHDEVIATEEYLVSPLVFEVDQTDSLSSRLKYVRTRTIYSLACDWIPLIRRHFFHARS